jgi:thiamine pyrophosphokinase
MKRCVILTAFNPYPSDIRGSVGLTADDFVICADGGYAYARKENIIPDVIIGDFDSWQGELPEDIKIIRFPIEKDDTDTLLCLKYGMEQGFLEFVIAGGMGGRIDHTVANLQCMSFAAEHGKKIWMIDSRNAVTIIDGCSIEIKKQEGRKLSLLSFSEECRGVSAKGVRYPLQNAVLKNDFPLGASNEFIAETAEITCLFGKLLVCVSAE